MTHVTRRMGGDRTINVSQINRLEDCCERSDAAGRSAVMRFGS